MCNQCVLQLFTRQCCLRRAATNDLLTLKATAMAATAELGSGSHPATTVQRLKLQLSMHCKNCKGCVRSPGLGSQLTTNK